MNCPRVMIACVKLSLRMKTPLLLSMIEATVKVWMSSMTVVDVILRTFEVYSWLTSLMCPSFRVVVMPKCTLF